MNEEKARLEIVEVGRRMYQKGFVASNDGNLSVRLDSGRILITPTGVSKGYMAQEDLIVVDMDGKVLSGCLKPTSEIKMHLSVYRKRSDVSGVCHAHPPHATAFAVAGLTLEKITLPEVIFSMGRISLTEYGTPSTEEIPLSVQRHIHHSDALLLANHGALTVGAGAMDAYYKMETLEHFAYISLLARLLGGERELKGAQLRELYRVRSEVYGKRELHFEE